MARPLCLKPYWPILLRHVASTEPLGGFFSCIFPARVTSLQQQVLEHVVIPVLVRVAIATQGTFATQKVRVRAVLVLSAVMLLSS